MIRGMLSWLPAIAVLVVQTLIPLDVPRQVDAPASVTIEDSFLEERSRVWYTAMEDVPLSRVLQQYRLLLSSSAVARLNPDLSIPESPRDDFVLRKGERVELFIQDRESG